MEQVCALFQEVAEEALCGVLVHASSSCVFIVLLLTDAPYLWVACLWMHENQSADA